MKFQKHLTEEEQLFLNKSLEKYEQERLMSKSERAALHSWVASGNDPYTNGYGYCFENGHQMDFVEAERTCLELYEENKKTSS